MSICLAHQWLGGKMKDKIRIRILDGLPHRFQVAYVTDLMLESSGETKLIEQRWLGGRWQLKAVNFRA
jgi:hypothetical protein